MKKRNLALVLIICLSLFAAACGTSAASEPTATPSDHPGKALVASRCTTCHPLGTIQSAKKDPAGWEITVKRMVSGGAQLDQDQQAQAVEYLAATYPK